jgi:long-chain acyl-CoA synthetase
MPTHIRTLAEIPPSLLQRFPRPALVRRCHANGIEDWSTQHFVDQVRHVSLGLDALGVKAGDRVALISESRPEWLISDLGILSGAFVTVPIYPTLAAAQACYILNDSEARVAIVSDRVQLEKLQSIRHLAPHLAFVVVIDGGTPAAESADGAGSVLTLAELAARGREVEEREPGPPTRGIGALGWKPGALARHAECVASVDPSDLATIIYTSGTTGEPKGVMLTHHNIVSNVLACHSMLKKGPEDVAFSFLPLSHAFERTVSYCYLDDGVVVTFAETMDTVARDMPRVQPTLMTGVPRVFEKLHARIMEAASTAPAPRRWIFTWALGVGLLRVQREQNNGGRAVDTNWQDRLADKLVFSKIRERVGGRLRVVVSGSAPLPVPVAEFFSAVGLPVMEGYGLTETSPVLSTNPRDAIRIGTVGVALPGIELRIAEDGRGDGGSDRCRRLVSHRRHRQAGRWISVDHGSQEGSDRHVRRQEARAAAHRTPPEAESARCRGDRHRRSPPLSCGGVRA